MSMNMVSATHVGTRPAVVTRRVLDIGCGTNKAPGAIGMDINPRTDADVIHDLDDLPYPFGDNQFDEVIGRHVIEHVKEPMAGKAQLHPITPPRRTVNPLAPPRPQPPFPSGP